jgi:hypothetical protein
MVSDLLRVMVGYLFFPRELALTLNFVNGFVGESIWLRHANLSSIERYLGKVGDIEAMGWIESLCA